MRFRADAPATCTEEVAASQLILLAGQLVLVEASVVRRLLTAGRAAAELRDRGGTSIVSERKFDWHYSWWAE